MSLDMEPGKLYRDSELPPGFERETAPQPTVTTLVSFRDGSYKKVRHVSWKHSQWIHFKLADGSTVAVNPANVNYLHIED